MSRPLLFLGCFLSIIFLVFVYAYPGAIAADHYAPIAAQISPLVSPLSTIISTTITTTVQATVNPSISLATVNNGSPISLILVAAVLVGILVVIGLVIWRQR
jgi:hypothetical protein